MTSIRAAVALVVAATVAGAVLVPQPLGAQEVPDPTWWALGDSYASGEGIPGTDAGPWGRGPDGKTCERANGYTTDDDGGQGPSDARAWPVVAYDTLFEAESQQANLTLTACTGNITDDWANQREQARERSGSRQPDVISLGFGGNNIGFKDVLMWCLTTIPREIIETSQLRPPWVDAPGAGCATNETQMRRRVDALVGKNQDRMPAGQVRLPDLYRSVADAVRPGGHVFVLGYPQLIEDPARWPAANRFLGYCQGIDAEDASLWRTVVAYMNEQIALAVQAANATRRNDVQLHWLDVSQVYETSSERHGLCSSQGDQWLNGITVSLTSGDGRLSRSFHPTQAGHSATGAALAASIRDDLGGNITAPRSALTAEDLRSVWVPELCGHPAGTLVDGTLPDQAESSGFVELELANPPPALGDIDGDGVGDAAAVVRCSAGGVGWPDTVHIYNADGDHIAQFSAADFDDTSGERDVILGVEVADGRLHIDWSAVRGGDPACCPTLDLEGTFRLDGDGLVAEGIERTDEIPAATRAVELANDGNTGELIDMGLEQFAADELVSQASSFGGFDVDSMECTLQLDAYLEGIDFPEPASTVCYVTFDVGFARIFLNHDGFKDWSLVTAETYLP